MFAIYKSFTFEAMHYLIHHDGKCRRPHGHSYKLTLELRSPYLHTSGPQTLMLADFSTLSLHARKLLDELLDHRSLNETLNSSSPTAEFIAAWTFHRLKPSLPTLIAVVVEETATARAEFRSLVPHDTSSNLYPDATTTTQLNAQTENIASVPDATRAEIRALIETQRRMQTQIEALLAACGVGRKEIEKKKAPCKMCGATWGVPGSGCLAAEESESDGEGEKKKEDGQGKESLEGTSGEECLERGAKRIRTERSARDREMVQSK